MESERVAGTTGTGAGGVRVRLRHLLDRPRGGTAILAATAALVLFLAVAGLGFGRGWIGAWRLLVVPAADPPFADLHAVTDSIPCAARGIDVYRDGQCDPRRFNYPPVWLLLGRLGIDGADTPWLAVALGTGAVLVLAGLFRGRPVRQGLVGAVGLLSPSVTLAFERGNVDLLIFTLVGGAALLFREAHAVRRWGASALLGGAVVLKLYPVFGVTLLARFTKKTAAVIAALSAFSLLYLAAMAPWLALIRANTPHTSAYAYGYLVPFLALEEELAPRFGWDLAGLVDSALPAIALALVLAVAGAVAVRAWRRGRVLPVVSGGTAGTAFLLGAGIFCGTFLLGTDFQYRLIFLLLCLPQLLDWRKSAEAGTVRASNWLLGGCLTMLILIRRSPEVLFLDHAVYWVLFGAMAAVLAGNALHTMFPRTPLRRPA